MLEELSLNIMNKGKSGRKIGLLGGTFDPIHKAHINIALAAYEEYKLEKVIMVVSGNPPHKKNHRDITCKEDRYEMTKLVCEDYEMLIPHRYEIDKKELSFTYNSLLYFKKEFPEYELYFIMGEDSLFNIEKWKYPDKIMSLAKILVAERYNNHYEIDIEEQRQYLMNKYFANIEIMSHNVEYISSTMLRDRLSKGKDCSNYIPDKAIEFINRKGLYKK